MKNKFILLQSYISFPISTLANEDIDSIGILDENINQVELDNLPDYVPANSSQQYEEHNGLIRFMIKNGIKHVTVKNKHLLKKNRIREK